MDEDGADEASVDLSTMLTLGQMLMVVIRLQLKRFKRN